MAGGVAALGAGEGARVLFVELESALALEKVQFQEESAKVE